MLINNFKQCAAPWGKMPYEAGGDKRTICSDGCGICVIANIVSSFGDGLLKDITPIQTAKKSMELGAKAPFQGTYYQGMIKVLDFYGFKARQLNFKSLYKKSNLKMKEIVKSEINKGNLIICTLGPSKWTTSGHYVLLHEISGEYCRIKDSYNYGPVFENPKLDELLYATKYFFSVEVERSKKEMEVIKQKINVNGDVVELDTVVIEDRTFVKIADFNNTTTLSTSYENGIPTIKVTK